MFSISKLIVIKCLYNGLATVDYLQCTENLLFGTSFSTSICEHSAKRPQHQNPLRAMSIAPRLVSQITDGFVNRLQLHFNVSVSQGAEYEIARSRVGYWSRAFSCKSGRAIVSRLGIHTGI
ncbi:hypothetical protein NQ318_008026 [Aromia moschata]|uniref:Fumarate lyase N-terminal domain-containing protein n=1 Tax=Aromia moschata TaxID=1265417 RepID=A0AAV8XC84_9CUCU|nr:hypothetical protein NQ318_008026 [Aromia moschata]